MVTAPPKDDPDVIRQATSPFAVRDCMTSDPVTVAHDARASRVLELMERHHVMHVPVTRDGKLVGLVSERYLRDAMPSILTLKDPAARRRILEITPVSAIAIDVPETVSPETSLVDAIGKLRQLRAGSLPVTSGGHLVGILTAGDLVSLLEKILRGSIELP